MGRLTVLIGLFFMSLAVLSITWPQVKQEAEPVLLLVGETLLMLFEECMGVLRKAVDMFWRQY